MSPSTDHVRVFDDRVGAVIRALRMRRGLRQADVAQLALVSPMTVSRIERGQFETLSLRTIRRVARALEVRMDLAPWSRRGDLLRFATAEHAGLVEAIVRTLVQLGWDARAEVSFSHGGERGFVDVLAWHGASATLLVIEVKTEIVDVGELLGTLNRKRRLGPAIARDIGWEPRVISGALIVQATRTNRRRIAEHAATIRTQLPDGGQRLRALLRNPGSAAARTRAVFAVAYWSNEHPGLARPPRAGSRRVRRPRSCSSQGVRGGSTPRAAA